MKALRVLLLVCIALTSTAMDWTGEGTQTVTIFVRGVDKQTDITAEWSGVGTITLADPGIGVVSGGFRSEPARFMQLRLTAVGGGESFTIYDGLIVLADASNESIAFEYVRRKAARRIPVAPSARVDLALDERATWWVGFGWGALALCWVGLMGALWAFRRG